MTFWLWGAVFAFLGGTAVAGICYLISKQILLRAPARFSAFSIVRNLIQVGYFLAVYFLAAVLPWDLLPLLIGAALGVTLSTFYFTSRLVRLTAGKLRHESPEEKIAGGDERDG